MFGGAVKWVAGPSLVARGPQPQTAARSSHPGRGPIRICELQLKGAPLGVALLSWFGTLPGSCLVDERKVIHLDFKSELAAALKRIIKLPSLAASINLAAPSTCDLLELLLELNAIAKRIERAIASQGRPSDGAPDSRRET